MALKSAQHEQEKGEIIEELLGELDKALDRVKVLYEQFFLGMQKQAPTHLHNDVERKLRDLTQMHIRNTALRYRFATLQQKFGAYNSYWRRTLKQIEKGTYHRNLSKLSRQAATTGEEIPEEILAAMPKRMQEQVKRDREIALARVKRREVTAHDDAAGDELGGIAAAPRSPKTSGGAHVLDAADGEFDLDAYFASVTNDDAPGAQATPAAARPVVPTTPIQDRPAGIPPRPATPSSSGGIPTARSRAPSQASRPLPVEPGASARIAAVDVETMAGPFPRAPTAPARPGPRTIPPPLPPPRPGSPPQRVAPPPARRPGTEVGVPPASPRVGPPPGMSDADVNALYAKYVKAREAIGEPAGPGAYGKLLKTINTQAPKIMEQYKARGVDFQVVVKDNQVIIRAKPRP